jgi:hypothetical protein
VISKSRSKKNVLVLVAAALFIWATLPVGAKGFTHGIVIDVDGEDYYLAGAPDGPDGTTDIPGHYWEQAGPNQYDACT